MKFILCPLWSILTWEAENKTSSKNPSGKTYVAVPNKFSIKLEKPQFGPKNLKDLKKNLTLYLRQLRS